MTGARRRARRWRLHAAAPAALALLVAACGSGTAAPSAAPTTVRRAVAPDPTLVETTAYPTAADDETEAPDDSLFLSLGPVEALTSEITTEVAVARATPGAAMELAQCRSGRLEAEECVVLAEGAADPNGGWLPEVPLRRYVQFPGGRVVDCGAAAGRCVVRVDERPEPAVGSPGKRSALPLTYDPASPADAPPVLAVDRTIGLTDGAEVVVATAGFRSGEIRLGVCEVGTDRCAPVWPDAPLAPDTFATVELPRVLTDPATGSSLDCAAELGRCELRGLDLLGDDLRVRPVQLFFDPGAPVRPGIEMTVTPTEQLTDGQEIVVRITGYRPGERVQRPIQCALVPEGGACDLPGRPTLTPADDDGVLEYRLRVATTVATSAGEVSCGERICVVRGQAADADGTGLLRPITFAP